MTKITQARRNRMYEEARIPVFNKSKKLVGFRFDRKAKIDPAIPTRLIELGEGEHKSTFRVSIGQKINTVKNKIRRARKDQHFTQKDTRKKV